MLITPRPTRGPAWARPAPVDVLALIGIGSTVQGADAGVPWSFTVQAITDITDDVVVVQTATGATPGVRLTIPRRSHDITVLPPAGATWAPNVVGCKRAAR